jgi:hypothetical protein
LAFGLFDGPAVLGAVKTKPVLAMLAMLAVLGASLRR